LFIVIPFDGHGLSLSGPTARVMIVISYLTVMQMHNARKQTVNGDDIQSMTSRSENQFDGK
jgi:hypothetical protein